MKPVVFLGPSLAIAEARRVLDADYRPPAACGDVYRAARDGAQQIALIDGYFDGRASVWHKELLWAISQGVQVFGGASMGALRAAELADFSMLGVGRIFQDYRRGVLEDDDEVAVLHSPAELDYRPLSEALVNIRATLQAACKHAVLSTFEAGVLLVLGKQTFYRERGWERLFEDAQGRIDAARLDIFKAWLSQHRVDQKRQDAYLLLRYLRRIAQRPPRKPALNFVFEPTQSWQRLIAVQDSKAATQGLTELDNLVLDELRVAGDYPRLRQQAVLLHHMRSPDTVSINQAECKALLKQRFRQWRQTLGLDTRQALEQWLTRMQKSLADVERALQGAIDSAVLQNQYGAALHSAMIDTLVASGDYAKLAEQARAKQQMARNSCVRAQTPPVALLLDWFAQHCLGQDEMSDPQSCAHELGLTNADELAQLARREYRLRLAQRTDE